jgi:hypothetical protein
VQERVWHVGDFVEIECRDGARFHGVLADIQENYVLFASGYGFASGTIKAIRPVPR